MPMRARTRRRPMPVVSAIGAVLCAFGFAANAIAQTAPNPGLGSSASPNATSSAPAGTTQPPATALPSVDVTESKPAAQKKPKKASARKTAPIASPTNTAGQGADGQTTKAETSKGPDTDSFARAREDIFTQLGTNPYDVGKDAIEALPQGTETPVSKVLLQTPGVSQDSAAAGQVHVRNEHANLQYRINGILLPDGVSGFGDVLETGFIGGMSLVTGALPAEYGLHTSGLVDITTRAGSNPPEGTLSVYGGSRGTLTPSLEYGGTSGAVDYFFTGRYLENDIGIENPTPSWNAIHDHTEQEKGFGYISARIDDTTRLSWISGISLQNFQIPNTPGLPLQYANPVGSFNSALLDEHQFEQNYYDVIALQRKLLNADWQLAYFARYSDLHFHPDQVGDLVFNGIASDVERSSLLNGIQGDASYRFNAFNTLRTGFTVSAEQTRATDASRVLPAANPDGGIPVDIFDQTEKLGWLFGIYVQDEWKITDRLTLNAGLRFDQMWEYVDANQFSPRVSLEYRPFDGTKLHAGYARYFTPPPQVAAGPTNVAAFDGTIGQSETCGGTVAGTNDSPCGAVLPERSHYFDAGITQTVFPGLEVGVDAYYKLARDLLDDGQFGAALVLDAFNYEKAINKGIELKANYTKGNFSAYGNVAFANQRGNNIVSNQYLIGADDLAYIADHYIYTDHSQNITASAGLSYLWDGTRLSVDAIYGSGLRTDAPGVPNGAHVPAYTQVNLGLSHEFHWVDQKPTTLRFDIVNLFDEIYEIRDGEGVGVFASQYGPRRGYFVGLAQKF